MSTACYFASIQKSMSVASSVVLTSPTGKSLLIAKKNRIEVMRLTTEGLREEHEVNLYARVLHLTNLQCGNSDMLVIVTNQMKIHLADSSWRHCDVVEIDRDLKQLDYPPLFAKDPQERVLCAHLFTGMLHVVWVNKGTTVTLKPVVSHFLGSYSRKVKDIAFLSDARRCNESEVESLVRWAPRLAVLDWEESTGLHFSAFDISATGFTALADHSFAISAAAGRLFSLQRGEVAIATPDTLWMWQPGEAQATAALSFAFQQITAVTQVDAERWVCSNEKQQFICLRLTHTKDFQVVLLGEASKASCISYLDNSWFYLGSETDYQMIIRVTEANRLEVVSKWQNLSPIVDAQVLTNEYHSEPEFVLSSSMKPSAVTVMSKNVHVQMEAEVEVGKVTGMWPASKNGSSVFDYLVLSYIAETRVQELSNFTLTPVELPGFDHETSTLLAGNLGTAIVQVTSSAVNLLDSNTALTSYKPTAPIQQASICQSHMLLVTSDNVVSLLNFANKRLTLASMWQSPHDVSCVVCNDHYAVVGVWFEFTIRIMALPDLTQTWREQLSVDVLPRSLFFKRMNDADSLFCGLGDGNLLIYSFSEGRLDNQRNLQVGREAVQFSDLGENRVLISASVPKVACMLDGKLQLSQFNLENIQTMCNFTNADIPGCLAAVKNNMLLLMRAENIQLISLMRYYPGRIVHSARVLEDNFVLITSESNSPAQDRYYVQVIEKVSELSYQFALDDDEIGVSLLVYGKFIIVGTTSENMESGTLRVLTFTRRELTQVFTTRVDEAPMCMRMQAEDTIAITQGKHLSLWTLAEDGAFTLKCKPKRAFTLLVALDCLGDVIAVGDMVKAVTLFRLVNNELEEVSNMSKVLYVADVALLTHNLVLVSDVRGNVVLFRYGGAKQLEQVARWHMQEKLNCLRTSVVTPLMTELSISQVCYYASVEGSVGLIALISDDRYKLLSTLQEVLSKRVAVFKQVAYSDMRMLTDMRPKDACNFIDGDLLQQFLTMNRADQETIAMEMAAFLPESSRVSVNELQKLIFSYSLLI